MGVVYMAEQERPVRRRVALKLVKAGMDSRQVVARFEAERQALAVMDHPNIARVFDAGTTDAGRPFFVMELVQGPPITSYCDAKRLTLRDRLALFVQVCQAVQHAHTKGIIHRDLKPTNILVATLDGHPVPKVIDFGVAKALHQRLTDRTMFTSFGAVVGTYQYMSPEQAEMDLAGTDTRSDVYSLGVLLYELLTGGTPLDRERLKNAAFGEVLRIIREEEPPRPSTRISQSSMDVLTAISARRGTDSTRLGRQVAGDLDWIVMRSMEKDRNRRYETANALGADVQRFLEDQPVEARPPSVAYKFRKFARRNKVALSMGVALCTVLMVATGVSVSLAVQARGAKRLAEARLDSERMAKDDAERAKTDARAEAERAKTEAAVSAAILSFLNDDLLAQADLAKQSEPDIRLKTVLDRAGRTIDQRSFEKPLVEAAIRHVLGTTYASISREPEAIRHLERASELRRQHAGPDHGDTLRSMAALAKMHSLNLNHDRAEVLMLDTVARSTLTLGRADPETLRRVLDLANDYFRRGRVDECITLTDQTLQLARKSLAPDHAVIRASLNNLALCYWNYGHVDSALKLWQELASINHNNGVRDMIDVMGNNNHAIRLANMSRYEEACRVLEEATANARSTLGPDDPNTLTMRRHLSKLNMRLRRYDVALDLQLQTLSLATKRLGEDDRITLESLGDVSYTYRCLGRCETAVQTRLQLLAKRRARFGLNHQSTVGTLRELADDLFSGPYEKSTAAERLLESKRRFKSLAEDARNEELHADRDMRAADAGAFVRESLKLAEGAAAALDELNEAPGPFDKAPTAIPGRIDAYKYDRGGLGIGYHDRTLGSVKDYGPRLGMVDFHTDKDGAAAVIADTESEEWLAYTVDVAEEGEYELELRTAGPGSGGQLHVVFGDEDVTGHIDLPNTGGWEIWRTTAKHRVKLKAGRQKMRVVFDREIGVNHVCNLNWMRFTRAPHGEP
jgi:eukaryotic-like serine/threonine-protein kinase